MAYNKNFVCILPKYLGSHCNSSIPAFMGNVIDCPNFDCPGDLYVNF